MKLCLRADDKMPWGPYKEMTLRQIYKNAPAYYKENLLSNHMIEISLQTRRILSLDLDDEEITAIEYPVSLGSSAKKELKPLSKLKHGPYEGKTLIEIYKKNSTYFRYLLISGVYYISKKTYNEVVPPIKRPKEVVEKPKKAKKEETNKTEKSEERKKLDRKTIDLMIDENIEKLGKGINPEKDLPNYIGERVETSLSKKNQAEINKMKLKDTFNLRRDLRYIFNDKNAAFRDGQEDVILSVLNGRNTLVVQKTSWGKSLVYFLAAKKLREMGLGPIIIISPLIALMRDQVQKLQENPRYNLVGVCINEENRAEWDDIYDKIKNNSVDVIFIAPEKLDNFTFMKNIREIVKDISMFVIDEAHCISDWGHDFRPDFRRIARFVKELSPQTRILATTATANNRVVRDIKYQLGEIEVSVGCLLRENFYIDVLNLQTDEAKRQWLLRNLPKLLKKGITGEAKNPGIIYCQTRKETEELSKLLNSNGIVAEFYHARVNDSSKDKNRRKEIEKQFAEKKYDVLCSTIAFGMGVDIDNIGFVIHYSQVKGIIEYYQQIGRGGRNSKKVNKMFAITLCGDYDNDFNVNTIIQAFPSQALQEASIEFIKNNQDCSRELYKEHFKLKQERAEKYLKYMCAEGYLRCSYYTDEKHNVYNIGFRKWEGDMKRERIVSHFRWKEFREFNRFLNSDICYMKQIREKLDEPHKRAILPCGKCSICLGKHFFE